MGQSEHQSTWESAEESPQTSLLLQLAPELRNIVYDAVVKQAERINWSPDRTFTHPLAQTCRQTRGEFYDLWAEKGRKHARSLHLHCTDFDYIASQQQLSESRLDHYPLGIVLHIHLTSEWERYLYRVRELVIAMSGAVSFALHLEDHGIDGYKGMPIKYLGVRMRVPLFENHVWNSALWNARSGGRSAEVHGGILGAD